MSNEKHKELEELRLGVKIAGLQRILGALSEDKWSDVAKLGKDSYVAVLKEENLMLQRRCLELGCLRVLGNKEEIRDWVESQQLVTSHGMLGSGEIQKNKKRNGSTDKQKM